MSGNILVVTEQINGELRKPSLEAISEARRIADKSGGQAIALIMGSGIDKLSSIPAQYGADKVLMADDEKLGTGNTDVSAAVVKTAAESNGVEIILMPATTQGRDLAPKVAVQLDAGLAEDCLDLQIEGGQFKAVRPMYAGKVIATVVILSDIKIATLRPNLFEASEPDSSRSASVESLSVPDVSPKSTLKEFKSAGGTKMDLTEADIIVTGGRGMKNPENFGQLEELADLLGGVVGSTRAAVDAGFRPHSDQVGQTGKTVTPNLYMMFGASGAIQHWAGMSGAKCIVAVNKDPEAPIMGKADYSILGDLFEVVPVLTAEIKKIKG